MLHEPTYKLHHLPGSTPASLQERVAPPPASSTRPVDLCYRTEEGPHGHARGGPGRSREVTGGPGRSQEVTDHTDEDGLKSLESLLDDQESPGASKEDGETKEREKRGPKMEGGGESCLFLEVQSITFLALCCNKREIRLICWKVY